MGKTIIEISIGFIGGIISQHPPKWWQRLFIISKNDY